MHSRYLVYAALAAAAWYYWQHHTVEHFDDTALTFSQSGSPTANLGCADTGASIKVATALYGSTVDRNWRDELVKVAALCDGQKACDIKDMRSTFGELPSGNIATLRGTYSCVKGAAASPVAPSPPATGAASPPPTMV